MNSINTLFVYYLAARKSSMLRALDDLWTKKVRSIRAIKLLLYIRLIISLVIIFMKVNLVFAACEYLIFHHTFVHAGDYLLDSYLVMKFVVDLYYIFDIENYQGKLILNT